MLQTLLFLSLRSFVFANMEEDVADAVSLLEIVSLSEKYRYQSCYLLVSLSFVHINKPNPYPNLTKIL